MAGVTVSEGKTLGERKCKTFVFVFLRRIKKFKMERKKIFFYVPARKAPECACEVTFAVRGCLDGSSAGDGKLYHEVTKAFENNVVHVLPDVLSVCFCDRKFHLMNCASTLLCAVDRGVS